jgi:hypothetical protein
MTSTPYALHAANFTGTVADAQLSANVPRLNAPQTFSASNLFTTLVVADGSGTNGQGGRLHIGGFEASADSKLIYFGDEPFVYLGENGRDDTLEFQANRFVFKGGYVSIGGTNIPHHQLRIVGGVYWTSDLWQGALELDNASAIGWNANASGNRFGIGQTTAGLQVFATASDPGTVLNPPIYLLTFDNSGRVGINTTTPAYNLHVNGSAGKPGGGAWSDSSDARIKKNIEPLTGALDKLTQLRGVSFEWVNPEDHANQTGRQGGFVAQEVERAFPHWVQEVHGAARDAALTPNGKIKSLSLPFEFDALLVEALRELRAENADLKKRLADIEQHLKSLLKKTDTEE